MTDDPTLAIPNVLLEQRERVAKTIRAVPLFLDLEEARNAVQGVAVTLTPEQAMRLADAVMSGLAEEAGTFTTHQWLVEANKHWWSVADRACRRAAGLRRRLRVYRYIIYVLTMVPAELVGRWLHGGFGVAAWAAGLCGAWILLTVGLTLWNEEKKL